MYKLFRLSKISKKGTKIVISLTAAIMAVFLCILIPVEITMLRQQIIAGENKTMAASEATLESELVSLINVSVYLSTLKLINLESGYSVIQYKDYLNMHNQIIATAKSSQYIEEIYLYGSGGEYSTDPDYSYSDVLKGSIVELGSKMGIKLFKSVSETDSFYYFQYMDVVEGNNQVIIKLNSRDFSELIFNPNNDLLYQGWVDSQGIVAFSSWQYDLGAKFSKSFSEDFKKDYSIKKTVFNGTKGYLSTDKIDDLDLYLVQVSRRDAYSKNWQSFTILLSLALVVLVFVFLTTVLICDVTYRPFKKILDLLGYNQMNTINDETDAEYKYIIENIKKISEKNAMLDKQVNDSLEELRVQQMITCQSQICPHFIYNTLSAISSLSMIALKDRNNPITKSINNLAWILSETLNAEEKITTVRKEIEVSKIYIEILYTRYDNSFTVEWDVDERALDFYIIKFSLQPLIENAVKHAFEGTGENQKITVSIKIEEGVISVSVDDNGIGISPERLKEIEQGMNNFNTNSYKNVGLKNVNRRIKLIYGENYGLSVESKEGEGTRFNFTYPVD